MYRTAGEGPSDELHKINRMMALRVLQRPSQKVFGRARQIVFISDRCAPSICVLNISEDTQQKTYHLVFMCIEAMQ